jgi:hypothetical protein
MALESWLSLAGGVLALGVLDLIFI